MGTTTIIFTDLEDHTSIMRQLGDEAGRSILREHEAITRRCISRTGGSEIKSLGDGFMAAFPSAGGALECSVQLQRAFRERNTTAAVPLHVRVGINTGEPIAEDDDLFGNAVIAAARIAKEAQGDEVLVSAVTRNLVVGRPWVFADRGDHELKGFDAPERVYEFAWDLAPRPADGPPVWRALSRYRGAAAIPAAMVVLSSVAGVASAAAFGLLDGGPGEAQGGPPGESVTVPTKEAPALPEGCRAVSYTTSRERTVPATLCEPQNAAASHAAVVVLVNCAGRGKAGYEKAVALGLREARMYAEQGWTALFPLVWDLQDTALTIEPCDPAVPLDIAFATHETSLRAVSDGVAYLRAQEGVQADQVFFATQHGFETIGLSIS